MDRETLLSPSREMNVVLIGRFGAMQRVALTEQLRSAGASVSRNVTPTTTHVVVGSAGWPLRRNGQLPRELLVARILQARQSTPELIDELDFVRRFHISGMVDEKLLAIAGAPRRDDTDDMLSFRDHARARVLVDLLRAGVSPRKLQRAVCQLSRWFPQARESWEQLAPQWESGRWRLRLPDGGVVEPHGQRLFDFSTPDVTAESILSMHKDATDDLFGIAVAHEQLGHLDAAEHTYRRLLQLEGPDTDACFNLANVLVALNHRQAALERLWQCVELAPRFAEAWHNLGTVALELQQLEVAEAAFYKALTLAPDFLAAQIGRDAVLRLLVTQTSSSHQIISHPTLATSQ